MKIKLSKRIIYKDSPEPEVGLWRSMDHAYFANKSTVKGSATVLATDGQEVGLILDQIGTNHLDYVGNDTPLLSKARPRFRQSLGGQVFFPNELNLEFASDPSGLGYPRERIMAVALYNYQIYESFDKKDYLGDLASQGFRTRNGSDWSGDVSYVANIPFPLMSIFVLRQIIYADSPVIPQANGADTSFLTTSEVWMNGQKVDHLMPTLRRVEHLMGFGVDSNNSHCGFIFLLWRAGMNTTQQADAMIAELSTQYRIQEPYQYPYAKDVLIHRNNNNYSVAFNVQLYNGIGEDLTKRLIRWIDCSDNVSFSEYIPELDGKTSFVSSDYPSLGINSTTLRVEITVTDLNNRTLGVPMTYYTDNSSTVY